MRCRRAAVRSEGCCRSRPPPFHPSEPARKASWSHEGDTRHVLIDNVRMARDVIAEMTRKQSGVGVVSTACAVRNDEPELPARVEIHRYPAWAGRHCAAVSPTTAARATNALVRIESTVRLSIARPERVQSNAFCINPTIPPVGMGSDQWFSAGICTEPTLLTRCIF
jgi:hypothetical protein